MRTDSLFRLLFVVYCLEAGAFLVAAPWSAAWDRSCVHLPFATLRQGLLTTWARGALSGFGLVHWVWSAHDVGSWVLALRRPRREGA